MISSKQAFTAIWAGSPPTHHVAKAHKVFGLRRKASSYLVLIMAQTIYRTNAWKTSAKEVGNISVCRSDYHDILKKRLKRIGRWMQNLQLRREVFVDLPQSWRNHWPQRRNWGGSHTNLFGVRFVLFLGEIIRRYLLTGNLVTDVAPAEFLDVCPTNAFPFPSRPVDVFSHYRT